MYTLEDRLTFTVTVTVYLLNLQKTWRTDFFRCQNVPEADDDDLVQASPQAEFWHKVGSGNSPSTLQDKTAVQSSI